MKSTKKLLALVLDAVMLLGMLSGCGNTDAKPTTNNSPLVPTLYGMLVLSAEASFKISYDQDGMVMELTGGNEDGTAILETYDATGKSCATVVKELLDATAETTMLRDAHNVVLKLAVGSQLPSDTFLDSLAKEASDAVAANSSAAKVFTIGLDGLDADGYITLENAQALLLNQLGLEKFDSVNGDPSPRNGCYTLTVTYGDEEGYYTIDAVTGLISEIPADEMTGEPEYIEEEESFDPSLEEEAGDEIDGSFNEETTPAEEPQE